MAVFSGEGLRLLISLTFLIAGVRSREVIGILGSSGGDCESCAEVESFTKYFTKEGLLHAAPSFVGKAVSELIWHDMAKELEAEYAELPNCNTSFRTRSAAQTAAFAAAALRRFKAAGLQDVVVL